MNGVVADTHAIVWYLMEPARLSNAARAALNQAEQAGVPIFVSAITLIELRYLVEKGKLPAEVLNRVEATLSQVNSPLELVPIDYSGTRALGQVPRDAVPDMPDRIIAATALHLGLPLVSCDRKIQVSAVSTIW